ncbi:50S ribosomal protein L16 [Candidatus Micrarchaeota archaeon]|nr:50S ribosomal protein L16 [Candidatus Micrarchaeota archaeon]
MVGLRPARCVRDLKRVAWTRHSQKKPRKSYIRSLPHKELNVHRMGTKKDDYDVEYKLTAVEGVLLRDNAIESARQTTNKYLESKIDGEYYFLVRPYPHHIIRENKMAAGAGADRIQKGMRKSFGKPTDRAARMKKKSVLFSIYTYKRNEEDVRLALRRAKMKISGKWRIIAE